MFCKGTTGTQHICFSLVGVKMQTGQKAGKVSEAMRPIIVSKTFIYFVCQFSTNNFEREFQQQDERINQFLLYVL